MRPENRQRIIEAFSHKWPNSANFIKELDMILADEQPPAHDSEAVKALIEAAQRMLDYSRKYPYAEEKFLKYQTVERMLDKALEALRPQGATTSEKDTK